MIGIPRLPQTPIEGNQKFVFDHLKFKDAKHASKNHKLNGILNGTGHSTTKSPLVKSHNTAPPTKNSTLSHLKSPSLNESTASKSADTRKAPSHLKSPTHKETTQSKSTNSKKTLPLLKSPPSKETTTSKSAESRKTLSHLKSPTLTDTSSSKSVEMKKAEVKPVANGAFKSRQSDDKEKVKGFVKVKGVVEDKGNGDGENGENCKGQTNKSNSTSKTKPPKIKLSMPER